MEFTTMLGKAVMGIGGAMMMGQMGSMQESLQNQDFSGLNAPEPLPDYRESLTEEVDATVVEPKLEQADDATIKAAEETARAREMARIGLDKTKVSNISLLDEETDIYKPSLLSN